MTAPPVIALDITPLGHRVGEDERETLAMGREICYATDQGVWWSRRNLGCGTGYYICTRAKYHDGPHIGHGGSYIVGIWMDVPDNLRVSEGL